VNKRYALAVILTTAKKERIWVLLVVLYGFGKSLVVWGALGKYGVNPFIYLIVDIAAAIPYGIATARVVITGIARNWRQVQKWAIVATVTHFIPDIYIFSVIRSAPRIIIDGLISVIAFFTLVAIASVGAQMRDHRKRKSQNP